MAQDILPQGSEPKKRASNPPKPQVLTPEADPKRPHGPGQIRLPVGVALGLVFSLLLVIICGSIIAYLASSDRRIAMRLLDEQSRAVLKSNETVLHGFFKRQEQLFLSFAGHASIMDRNLTSQDLASYDRVLPKEVKLELRRAAPNGEAGNTLPTATWSPFAFKEGFSTAVAALEINLGNGQQLIGYFPQTVFSRLVRDMAWDDRQRNFLLKNRDTAIAVDGVPESRFVATHADPLPRLAGLTGTPLHLLWQETDTGHVMGGSVEGRLFPAGGRMYTAIYTEISGGPAQGWIVGTLYRAAEFGAVLDQTWAVLYVALAALVFGAILSFLVGRMLGRPLSRLAMSAAELRKLNFEAAERLPRSRLAEMDDVNQAFNGSVGALNAFAKYVPRQLVSRLIEEGMTHSRNIELREMTIVFTDLAGFTGKASHLTAEETASYLNAYFETVSDAIAESEGTIDKFLGDGVMAFWGAPSDQPDHAAMAIAAVRSLAERLERSGKRDMRVRIGVHTGKVVVGDIGTPSRMNYTVIGDAVNVAARLQEYGKHIDPDATVIALASAQTIAQMPEGFSCTSLGQVQLRGREEPLGVFRIA
ncbi:adenylate/guanylate cyclase domain-containing protein [Roseibium sp. HPY-6]|uniref:adenylate/guanylate cyclase domain-containing protein n=1 Tax=Roseibium sp. HPY-6 TaxID=3229852 RepID=UPI00338F5C17